MDVPQALEELKSSREGLQEVQAAQRLEEH
ncbi:MAG: cation-transporting P-type ATPase, partial [Bacillota bacterium]